MVPMCPVQCPRSSAQHTAPGTMCPAHGARLGVPSPVRRKQCAWAKSLVPGARCLVQRVLFRCAQSRVSGSASTVQLPGTVRQAQCAQCSGCIGSRSNMLGQGPLVLGTPSSVTGPTRPVQSARSRVPGPEFPFHRTAYCGRSRKPTPVCLAHRDQSIVLGPVCPAQRTRPNVPGPVCPVQRVRSSVPGPVGLSLRVTQQSSLATSDRPRTPPSPAYTGLFE